MSNELKMWQELGDIPTNQDDEIEVSFYDFEIGTHREEIWTWFEETFTGFSVAKAMGLS